VNVPAARLVDLAVTLVGSPAELPELLTPALEIGAVRAAVDSAGLGPRNLSQHYPLYQELMHPFRELRQEPSAVKAWPPFWKDQTGSAK
jgi:hypothetical protein